MRLSYGKPQASPEHTLHPAHGAGILPQWGDQILGQPPSDSSAPPQPRASAEPEAEGHPRVSEESPENEATGAPVDDELRERILSEYKEQEALEEFKRNRPDMWIQVLRVGRLVDFQEGLPEQTWPEGSCFLHASLAGFQSFAVRKVLDIDLDTCTVALEIYADEDLEQGTVLIPLEQVSWIGFPKNHVTVGHKRLRGFTAGLLADKD